MPLRRRNERVQFLLSLPSNDLAGWVNAHSTLGQVLAPGSVKTSLSCSTGAASQAFGHPTAEGGNEQKRRRQDFPCA